MGTLIRLLRFDFFSLKTLFRSLRSSFFPFLFVTTLILSSACSSLGVKPWEKDLMAKPDMALGANGIDDGLDDHIYFSKEASSGGRSFGGGGCGCN